MLDTCTFYEQSDDEDPENHLDKYEELTRELEEDEPALHDDQEESAEEEDQEDEANEDGLSNDVNDNEKVVMTTQNITSMAQNSFFLFEGTQSRHNSLPGT